jgi:hypothetical protein
LLQNPVQWLGDTHNCVLVWLAVVWEERDQAGARFGTSDD